MRHSSALRKGSVCDKSWRRHPMSPAQPHKRRSRRCIGRPSRRHAALGGGDHRMPSQPDGDSDPGQRPARHCRPCPRSPTWTPTRRPHAGSFDARPIGRRHAHDLLPTPTGLWRRPDRPELLARPRARTLDQAAGDRQSLPDGSAGRSRLTHPPRRWAHPDRAHPT